MDREILSYLQFDLSGLITDEGRDWLVTQSTRRPIRKEEHSFLRSTRNPAGSSQGAAVGFEGRGVMPFSSEPALHSTSRLDTEDAETTSFPKESLSFQTAVPFGREQKRGALFGNENASKAWIATCESPQKHFFLCCAKPVVGRFVQQNKICRPQESRMLAPNSSLIHGPSLFLLTPG